MLDCTITVPGGQGCLKADKTGKVSELIRDLEERSRAGCPFCSAAEKGTRFPAAFAPEGQIRVGRSVAVPNLFAKASLDAVVVVDLAGHVLSPSRIDPAALGTAFRAAVEVVRAVGS